MLGNLGVLLAPYSILVAEVLAVLLAGALLQRRLRVTRDSGVTGAGLAIVVVLTATGVWQSAAGSGDGQRQSLTPPPGVTYEEKCLIDQSAPQLVGLTRLLRDAMPGDAVYTGVGDTCVAYQLLPRVPAQPGQRADWEIFPAGLPPGLRRIARGERHLPASQRTVVVTTDGLGARRLTGGAR